MAWAATPTASKGYNNSLGIPIATGHAGPFGGKTASLISKYTFQTVELSLNLGQKSTGIFGVHGASGLQRILPQSVNTVF